MALRADEHGFLVGGDPVKLDPESFARAVPILEAVKRDTSAIRDALMGVAALSSSQAKAASRAASASSTERVADRVATRVARAVTQSRDERGRFVRPASRPATQAASVAAVAAAATASQQAATRDTAASRAAERDSRGRFVGGGGSNPSSDDDERPKGFWGRLAARFSGATDGLKDAASGIGQTAEAIDPAVAASKEVAEIVSPVGSLFRGIFGLFKSDKEVKWYKRIWNELRDLNKKSEGGGGLLGGLLGKVGGMFSGLFGGLGGMLGGAAGGGLLSRLFRRGGMLRRLGGGLLRRIPLLGGILAGGSALSSIFGGDDPSLSPEQNRLNRFKGGGSGIGAMIGMGLGLLGGPVGVVIGGIVGDLLGEKVGAWLSTFDWQAIGKDISAKFGQATAFIGQKWTEVGDWITTKFEAAAKSVTDMADNITKTITDWINGITEFGGKAKQSVVNVYNGAKETASSAANSVAELFGGGNKGRRETLLGAMDAAGMTNAQERAMFLAQMHHESGGFSSMEESFNYRSPERVMEVSATARRHGRDKVQAAMNAGPEALADLMYGGRMGNGATGDAHKYRGRGYVQLTGKAMYKRAGDALGLDLLNSPELAANPENAAKIALWYWKDSGAAAASRVGDIEAVTRAINGGRNGLSERTALTRQYLGSDVVAYNPAPPMVASGSVPQSVVSGKDSPFAGTGALRLDPANVPASPPSRRLIGSTASQPGATQITVKQPVGQNVNDRGIAHVATGGMGMYMGSN